MYVPIVYHPVGPCIFCCVQSFVMRWIVHCSSGRGYGQCWWLGWVVGWEACVCVCVCALFKLMLSALVSSTCFIHWLCSASFPVASSSMCVCVCACVCCCKYLWLIGVYLGSSRPPRPSLGICQCVFGGHALRLSSPICLPNR